MAPSSFPPDAHVSHGHPGRSNVAPTHFSSITVEGVSLTTALDHYLDWVEGRGKATQRRRAQGVPVPLDRDTLRRDGGETLLGENGAEIALRHDERSAVLRFIHRDDRYPDVYWYSVVRLRQTAGADGLPPAICVEHATGRALPPFRRLPPTAGAPAVLSRLLAVPGARARDRDLSTRDLRVRAGEAEDFVKYVLLDQARTLPLLLVSRTKDDNASLVDPVELQRLLHTQVIVADIDSDATWDFARAFEERGFSRDFGVCFDGAARLYHPGLAPSQNPREHYLWLPYRIESFGSDSTARLAGEVAERVTWRALPPRFFAILEDVDRLRSRERAASALRAEVGGGEDLTARVASFETLVAELKQQLQVAQEERAVWEEEAERYERERNDNQTLLEMAEQERDEAKAEHSAAQARVAALEARGGGLSQRQLSALRRFSKGQVASLTDALLLLEALYGSQVTILPSAWQSAEESAEFKKPDKAWELLLRLATDYWEAVQNGGDSEGKKCFSDATFASRESETVEGRKGARDRRTFRYKGADLVMWKHLKIGVKDSVSETWRCHFEFDADEKKVVIGHCGKHLDFK